MSIFSGLRKYNAGYRYSPPVTQSPILNNENDVKPLKVNFSAIGCLSVKETSSFDELNDQELSKRARDAHLSFK